MPASRLNWQAIKAEYIAGDDSVTHQAIATKYGCNPATVSRRASAEKWLDARSVYRQGVASKTLNRTSTTEAELRAKQLRVCDAVLAKGLAALKAMAPGNYKEALDSIKLALQEARSAAGIASELRHSIAYEVDYDSLTEEELERIASGESPLEVAPHAVTRGQGAIIPGGQP